MSIERKQIRKSYLLLCEGRDAEGFLINYLNSNALAQDSSDRYVTMPLGVASSSGAFDWASDGLEPLRIFLAEGFGTADKNVS